jgi:hypothetical protein
MVLHCDPPLSQMEYDDPGADWMGMDAGLSPPFCCRLKWLLPTEKSNRMLRVTMPAGLCVAPAKIYMETSIHTKA